MTFRSAALVLTAAAALGLAGTAGAVIIPQQGIAGAELLMSKGEVRGVLGEPKRVKHGSNIFGPYAIFRYGWLSVFFQGNSEVTAVATIRFNQDTPKGIGRGSTKAELKDAHERAKCRREAGGFHHCWIGRYEPGRRVTDFRLNGAERVERVVVGFVID